MLLAFVLVLELVLVLVPVPVLVHVVVLVFEVVLVLVLVLVRVLVLVLVLVRVLVLVLDGPRSLKALASAAMALVALPGGRCCPVGEFHGLCLVAAAGRTYVSLKR